MTKEEGESKKMAPEIAASENGQETGQNSTFFARIQRFAFLQPKKIIFKILKYSFFFFVITSILSIGAYNVGRIYYTDDKIGEILKENIGEQTGGKIEFQKIRIDLLKGISLNNLAFYSSAQSSKTTPIDTPLLKIGRIEFSYSILKLLIGRLHISAIKIVDPEIYLRKDDGEFNFNPILKYRMEKFPVNPEEKGETEKETEDSSSPSDIATLKSLLYYMPIEIMIHDIGVSNLKLELETFTNGIIQEKLHLSGVSIDIGANWYKTKSNFWVSLVSSFENPLIFALSKANSSANTEIKNQGTSNLTSSNPIPLKKIVTLKSAHIFRTEIVDLSVLKLDIASRMPELRLEKANYDDASIYSRGRINVSSDLKNLTIEEFEHQILDSIFYKLQASVTLSSNTFEKFFIQSEQNLAIDLEKISNIINPFISEITLNGKIRMEKLAINGEIDTKKFSNFEKAEGLPSISGLIWLENIWGSMDKSGISMLPMSGKISLLSSPKASQDGIQNDMTMDLSIPNLSLDKNIEPIGKLAASINNLSLKLICRLTWPDAIIPILNLDLEVEKFRANGSSFSQIDTPISLNINAEGDKSLSNITINQLLQVGGLAELSLNGSCQESCSRFRGNILARLESLKKIHQIVMPMGGTIIPKKFMPTELDGIADLQFNTKGDVPNPLKHDLKEILTQGDIRFNLQTTLSKILTKIPLMNLSINSFDNRIIANGNLKEQNFEISQKFSSLSLNKTADDITKPEINNGKDPQIELNQYSFDLQIKNEILSPIDISNPLRDMNTQLITWLHLGKLNAPTLFPKILTDISLDTDISQTKLNNFSVKKISFKLPDYGLSSRISLETVVDKNYLPLNFNCSLNNKIKHNGNEILPGGIKTTGQIETNIKLSSENMSEYNIDGFLGFDKFSLFLNHTQNQNQKPLLIEDISGEIPLKQKIKLPGLQEILAGLKTKENEKPVQNIKLENNISEKLSSIENIAKIPESTASLNFNLSKSVDHYLAKSKDRLKDSTNSIAIVDYPTIRPFFPDKRPLSIRRIDVANLELSNLEFDVELKQNWFALNQYIISFLGGKIQGAFLLSFDPSFSKINDMMADLKKIPKNIKTSVHLTRLDTRKLLERFPNLKGKGESIIPVFSNPYLDGTIHLSYDLLTNEIDGGIEITSIGKEQLKMMLFYIDPFEQNATITDIRGALDLGEVRQVSIPLKNGEIGMDVDVRLLGAPIPTPKLSRFPISQIIGNFVNQSESKNKMDTKNKDDKNNSALNYKKRDQIIWSNATEGFSES